MKKPLDLSLYLVLDAQACQTLPRLFQVAEEALAAGVTVLQLRSHHPQWTKRIWYDTAKELKALCQHFATPFIVNNELDIALAVDADGVHLGQDDLPIDCARALLGPDKILGLSTHTPMQALAADAQLLDYIGIGPIFPTRSKAVEDPILGLQNLQKIVAAKRLPAVAIGGIDTNSAKAVRCYNPEGIAVISAICCSKNIAEAVAALKA